MEFSREDTGKMAGDGRGLDAIGPGWQPNGGWLTADAVEDAA